MAESTLSLVKQDLSRSVAFYLNYGRKADSSEGLSTNQAANVDAARQAGERKFLIEEDWDFLAPELSITLWSAKSGTLTGVYNAGTGISTLTATTAKFFPTMIGRSIVIATVGTFTVVGYASSTVITVTGDATGAAKSFTMAAGKYRMPDDFGGPAEDEMRYAPSSGWNQIIIFTTIEMIERRWQVTVQTQRPRQAAFLPVATPGTTGQRYDMYVEPIPDSDYPVTTRYEILADALADSIYPYGGLQHAECIRFACLAAAEEMFYEGQQSQRAAFAMALDKSKAINRRKKAQRLGQSNTRYDQKQYPEWMRCIHGGAYGTTYTG